jgi:type VI secretion system protein
MVHPSSSQTCGARLCALLASLLAACALTACGTGPVPIHLHIDARVAPRSNQNSPVPVTLVVVHDRKLFERLSEMSAKQWYEQVEQLRRDFPGGDAFVEWQWEFVPGYNPPRQVVAITRDAVGVFVFARYRSAGAHRVRLGSQQHILLDLSEEDLSVTTLDAREQNP